MNLVIHYINSHSIIFILLMIGPLTINIMGGHDAGSQHQFTGIAKHFNSYTIAGRRNVSCVQHK